MALTACAACSPHAPEAAAGDIISSTSCQKAGKVCSGWHATEAAREQPAGGGRRWRQGPAWQSHGWRSSARSRSKLVATIQPISAPARSAVRSLLQAQPHPCSLRLFNTWSLCAPSSRAGEPQAAESAAKALASGSGSRTDGCSSCCHLQLALLLQPSHTWGSGRRCGQPAPSLPCSPQPQHRRRRWCRRPPPAATRC